jgi:hypothetical protein
MNRGILPYQEHMGLHPHLHAHMHPFIAAIRITFRAISARRLLAHRRHEPPVRICPAPLESTLSTKPLHSTTPPTAESGHFMILCGTVLPNGR